MKLRSRIADGLPDIVEWRRSLHADPELGFEETRTAAFIAAKLREFGLEVHEGIGRTGVVGVLRRGNGPMVGLRAEMDALPILEATDRAYASKTPGVMHACGHDGHTAMLLGAARLLAQAPPPDGAIAFIFQPAEETLGGGKAMIDEGLFRDFPVGSVFGLHNWPGVPEGRFAIHTGPVMAANDTFELVIEGRAGHAAMPHQTVDPVSVAAQIFPAWQTIISRNVDPADAAVISVTQIHAGDAWNVVPQFATLRGTVRTLRAATRDMIQTRMTELSDRISSAFGAHAAMNYTRRYPTTINTKEEALLSVAVACECSESAPMTELAPSMAAEDFSYMLQEKLGAYVWLGSGPAEGGHNLHSPHYDFNERLLPIGVEYWFRLAHRALGTSFTE